MRLARGASLLHACWRNAHRGGRHACAVRKLCTAPDGAAGAAANSPISASVKRVLEPVHATAPLEGMQNSDVTAAPIGLPDIQAHADAAGFAPKRDEAVDFAQTQATPAADFTSATPLESASNTAAAAAATSTPVEQAAEAVAAVDPAASAQAAETVFSFSDALLQPTIFLLNSVHDYAGLPWWLAIGASTILVRTAILPLTLMTVRNSAKVAALQPEITVRREKVMEAMRSGDQKKAMVLQNDMKDFMRGAGVGPAKILVGPFAQFPIFISFFVGVRRLAENDPTMATGGAFWFTNLSLADPIYALPVMCGASLALMTELGGDAGATKMTPTIKRALRIMAVLSVPFTYWMPASVFCYWLPNNLFSLVFSGVIRTGMAKKRLGLNVDLAKIPGTKAYANAMREIKLNRPAQTSYSSRGDAVQIGAKGERPVLLKNKPKKRKKLQSQ